MIAAMDTKCAADNARACYVAGALRTGASRGALVGLTGGWLVDLVPPGSSALGTAALVYAAAGLLAGAGRREGQTPFGWVAVVGAASALLVTTGRLVVAALSGAAVDWQVVGGRLVVTTVVGTALVPLLVRLEGRLDRRRR